MPTTRISIMARLSPWKYASNPLTYGTGSVGTYPRAVQTAFQDFQSQAEGRPDPFSRYTQPRLIDEARAAVASLLNVRTDECVLVKNATTGVNTVLRNLEFQPGDVLVYFDTVYGAVEKALVSLLETTPLQIRKVPYQFPISHDELVARFLATVHAAKDEGLNVRVAVFDTIVSMPGVRFPFERLVAACRAEGVLSCVDGAHGIGQIPLDLGALQPDFFTSNCHKWLYVPRGCAVLYVPRRNQALIRTTLPTSWGFIPASTSPATAASTMRRSAGSKSPFEQLFELVSTTDDTAYLCVPAALKFRAQVCGGEDRIYAYLETLAHEAGDAVAAALGTEVLQEPGLKDGEVSQLRRCALATVRLPIAVAAAAAAGTGARATLLSTQVAEVVGDMQQSLVRDYGTFLPVFAHGGWLWTRLSAQVYLEKSDFEWVGGVLDELCNKVVRKVAVAKE
ncbi:putative aminotransferase family protein (LolT) [Aspergillus clavatus NRRL 1]|uniref:Aminotransferase, putative n=1 Tax=Aspergillus clavatus (strain ATCC 1007 / CBS 513.65 / DSM 816 / NCTC 3887 / NRRL 1 / QM 1276 / 107) TaxID=344612 RepID=A1C706_ASPCL|nr:aminotransferase, putative [Aspergillus clavatus NRRL 1]EAW14177.1 aminotransferase, putative [Aspergillus clavatus NRRL 1]